MPPSSACRSTLAAASPAATRSKISSAASATARRPGEPRRSFATRPPTNASAPAAPPPASFPPTAPKTVWRLAGGLSRGRPGEGECCRRLAAVFAPGLFAEGADRVERGGAFVGRAAHQVGPGGRRYLVRHVVVGEEQRRCVHRVVEPLQRQLVFVGKVRCVLDLH